MDGEGRERRLSSVPSVRSNLLASLGKRGGERNKQGGGGGARRKKARSRGGRTPPQQSVPKERSCACARRSDVYAGKRTCIRCVYVEARRGSIGYFFVL